ncbi:MAG: hypothetical protein MUC64_01425 [Rubritepida sp.]|nr:hypothetical protein [Rubritepida sp.]
MRAALTLSLLLLPPLLAGPAAAQSSNSSSNCSDGWCTRVESWRPDDRRGGPGWTRVERWVERPGGWHVPHPPAAWGWGWAPPRGWHRGDDDDRPRRSRRGRDDDDD